MMAQFCMCGKVVRRSYVWGLAELLMDLLAMWGMSEDCCEQAG